MPGSRPCLRLAPLALLLLLPLVAPPAQAAEPVPSVLVQLERPQDAARLDAQGLDVTRLEGLQAEVLLWGADDRRRLAATGLPSRVLEDDALAASRSSRAQERRLQRASETDAALRSELPTGRNSYRTIAEVNDDLRRLATRHPDDVRLLTLAEPSLLGEPVLGAEISRDVRTADGKPTFLLTGAHHAREWPTPEFALEFAFDLLERDQRGDDLLGAGRLLLVPVVNVDGYDVSRRLVIEQKRKNCRVAAGEVPTRAACEAGSSSGELGVDNNRNYGAFWGGPGSSASITASNHRGEAPFSEPETRNMLQLLQRHQPTVAVNLHTPDAKVLRAPSSSNEPIPADVGLYQSLADRLNTHVGTGGAIPWDAGPWTEVYYEASGTAEQTAYYGLGTMAFTPETAPGFSGAQRFHPPYENVVDQYEGVRSFAGSSVREMLFDAFAIATDPTLHATITTTAPPGARLTLSRTAPLRTSGLDGTATSGVPVAVVQELTVPADGRVRWSTNPSERPSQEASVLLPETWTLRCAGDAGEAQTQVFVRRGDTAAADLSACGPLPGASGTPAPPAEPPPAGPGTGTGTTPPGVARVRARCALRVSRRAVDCSVRSLDGRVERQDLRVWARVLGKRGGARVRRTARGTVLLTLRPKARVSQRRQVSVVVVSGKQRRAFRVGLRGRARDVALAGRGR